MPVPTTNCFSALNLRRAIEHNVLDLYESDATTLKDFTQWPGYYTVNPETLGTPTRIPAVYVVGQTQVPAKYEPRGVECTIYDVPDPLKEPSRGVRITRDRWRVRFTNYGISEGVNVNTSLLTISRRMTAVFQTIEQIYSERNEISYENLICYITIKTIDPVFVPA